MSQHSPFDFEAFDFQEKSVDFQEIFHKYFAYWPAFVVSILITLTAAYFFNKYTPKTYKVSTTVLIEENKGAAMNLQKILGYGMLGGNTNLQNEVGILKSHTLAYRTINKLDFEISYFHVQNLITKELYQNSPLLVDFDKTHPQLVGVPFMIEILSENKFKLMIKEENLWTYDFLEQKNLVKHKEFNHNASYHFNEVISHPLFKFKVSKSPTFFSTHSALDDLSFTFNNINTLVSKFSNFEIKPINQKSSIVSLTLSGENVHKSVNFLNQLTHEYLEIDLEKKNLVAINTIDFITNELKGITDSLNVTENVLQDFQASKQIMNIDFQAQQVLVLMKELESEKAILLVKSKYYKNLSEYLLEKNSKGDIVVPSSIGIEDPLLNILVLELTQLFNTRSELLYSSTEKNPMILSMDQQIKNIKLALIENINNIVNTSNIAIKDINDRINKLNQKISHLPQTQRQLFSLERKFKLNDAIYTFLLEKLSEAQITKASNRSNNEVIDPADVSRYQKTYPKNKKNYIMALFLGLVIPFAYILGKEYLNNKIIDRKDVEKLTKLPIVGHVLHNSLETELTVISSPKSSITESFRSIRTNIKYLAEGKEKQIIMVTSAMAGAGKSFVAMNLASIFAQYEKKIVLLGFDLRKPKIFQNFNLTNSFGLSTYYINMYNIEEIIQKTMIDNLDIITAGPIPPNPSELIASIETKKLFEKLSKIYDYIIIDTPPIGLVTDAFLLMEHADVNLFIARQDFTVKKIFESIIKDIEQKELPNFSILINDVKPQKGSYGYGYGYGYSDTNNAGQGYYTDDLHDQRKSFFKRLFSKY